MISLITDNGINTLFFAFLVKFDGTEKVAVIRHGNRIHAQAFRQLNQLRDSARSIKQAIVRMAMQMAEWPGFHEKGLAGWLGLKKRCIVPDPEEPFQVGSKR